MSTSWTIEREVRFQRREHGGRKQLRARDEVPEAPAQPGRVPRVARLLALAHRFEELIRRGAVPDYAALAELSHVTRARISQISNLLLLAPDIQEEILHLPLVERGRDPIHLRQLQPIALTTDWKKQRRMWRELKDFETNLSQ